MGFEELYLLLADLNPMEGINQFSYVNPRFDLSDVWRKVQALDALEGMIRILAVGDRPIPRDQWATTFY